MGINKNPEIIPKKVAETEINNTERVLLCLFSFTVGNLLNIKPLPHVVVEAPGLGALAVRAEPVLLGGDHLLELLRDGQRVLGTVRHLLLQLPDEGEAAKLALLAAPCEEGLILARMKPDSRGMAWLGGLAHCAKNWKEWNDLQKR